MHRNALEIDMSDDAKTLLHYASHSRDCGTGTDYLYCESCARDWAVHIIGAGC